MSWNLVPEHLFIVLAASLLSILVGVSLGIWAYVSSKTRPVILRVVDLLQTIPSLAMLGIIMVFLGAGKITVIIGITLYSLLPIVRNTCLGLQQVDPGVKEAARGMGMSKPYRILMVEFPLAIPTVFTGVRIAVVNAIGDKYSNIHIEGLDKKNQALLKSMAKKPDAQFVEVMACDGGCINGPCSLAPLTLAKRQIKKVLE